MNFGHFPNKNEYVKTKNRKTKTGIYNEQFPDRGTNEVYILFFNLNGRKKQKTSPSNIKLARQITMLKNVQITKRKTQFSTFICNHQQT